MSQLKAYRDNRKLRGLKTLETYATIQGGNNRVSITIQNTTREPIKLKKGTVVGMVTVANVVPPMLAAKMSTYHNVPGNGTEEPKTDMFPRMLVRTRVKLNDLIQVIQS